MPGAGKRRGAACAPFVGWWFLPSTSRLPDSLIPHRHRRAASGPCSFSARRSPQRFLGRVAATPNAHHAPLRQVLTRLFSGTTPPPARSRLFSSRLLPPREVRLQRRRQQPADSVRSASFPGAVAASEALTSFSAFRILKPSRDKRGYLASKSSALRNGRKTACERED